MSRRDWVCFKNFLWKIFQSFSGKFSKVFMKVFRFFLWIFFAWKNFPKFFRKILKVFMKIFHIFHEKFQKLSSKFSKFFSKFYLEKFPTFFLTNFFYQNFLAFIYFNFYYFNKASSLNHPTQLAQLINIFNLQIVTHCALFVVEMLIF